MRAVNRSTRQTTPSADARQPPVSRVKPSMTVLQHQPLRHNRSRGATGDGVTCFANQGRPSHSLAPMLGCSSCGPNGSGDSVQVTWRNCRDVDGRHGGSGLGHEETQRERINPPGEHLRVGLLGGPWGVPHHSFTRETPRHPSSMRILTDLTMQSHCS